MRYYLSCVYYFSFVRKALFQKTPIRKVPDSILFFSYVTFIKLLFLQLYK